MRVSTLRLASCVPLLAVLGHAASVPAARQTTGTKVVLTNDDGWAVANVRALFQALVNAGYNVCNQFSVIVLGGAKSVCRRFCLPLPAINLEQVQMTLQHKIWVQVVVSSVHAPHSHQRKGQTQTIVGSRIFSSIFE